MPDVDVKLKRKIEKGYFRSKLVKSQMHFGYNQEQTPIPSRRQTKKYKYLSIKDIINIVEKQASCELYGLLKRPDEKFVTERAYDNPKFVEDMVRDIAQELKAVEKIDHFVVESENFESIHNHSAYALIKGSNI